MADVEEGGETAFPKAFAKDKYFDPAVQGAGSWSACAREYVAARPKKGDALLFYSLNPDLRQDQFSFHTGALDRRFSLPCLVGIIEFTTHPHPDIKTCEYRHTDKGAHTHSHQYKHTHARIHPHTRAQTHTHTHTHTHTPTHTRTHTHARARTHTHTHTCFYG
jgi:hypothetical protein